jgi:hypothetical protein
MVDLYINDCTGINEQHQCKMVQWTYLWVWKLSFHFSHFWWVSQGERIWVFPIKEMFLLIWGMDLQGWVRYVVRKQAPLTGDTDPEFLGNRSLMLTHPNLKLEGMWPLGSKISYSWKSQECPMPIYTRPRESKGPRKFDWGWNGCSM